MRVRFRLAGRCYPVVLRPLSGDIAKFYEQMLDQYYGFDRTRVLRARRIVDLGANVGLASLYLAATHRAESVVCVEADADNFSLLRRNLSTLGARCTLVHAAVFSDSGRELHLSAHGPSWSRTLDGRAGPTRAVRTVSMHDVLAECPGGRADLVKANIEGAERQVVGTEDGWLERVGAIVIELHDPYPYERFTADMAERGWRVYRSGSELGNNSILAVPASVEAA